MQHAASFLFQTILVACNQQWLGKVCTEQAVVEKSLRPAVVIQKKGFLHDCDTFVFKS